MTLARVQQLLDWAANSEGRYRIHLLSEAGEILRTLSASNPEVEMVTQRRATLVFQITDASASDAAGSTMPAPSPRM